LTPKITYNVRRQDPTVLTQRHSAHDPKYLLLTEPTQYVSHVFVRMKVEAASETLCFVAKTRRWNASNLRARQSHAFATNTSYFLLSSLTVLRTVPILTTPNIYASPKSVLHCNPSCLPSNSTAFYTPIFLSHVLHLGQRLTLQCPSSTSRSLILSSKLRLTPGACSTTTIPCSINQPKDIKWRSPNEPRNHG